MTIGIIGSGNIGRVLSKKLVQLGHQVFVANSRGPESLTEFAKETGATPVTVLEAAKSGDVVIITIPEKNIPDLPTDLFKDVPENVVIIETGNYYPKTRDGLITAMEDGITHSEWVEQIIGRPVIKAFNNIEFNSLRDLGQGGDHNVRVALPVAGDNQKNKEVVMKLVDELGFAPLDSGPLSSSWKQQPGTPAYCTDLQVEELAAAIDGLGEIYTPEHRETMEKTMDLQAAAYQRALQNSTK
jgi:predicted dinucleotide-binding enzyme